jgi:hypothetical protein
MGIIQSLRIYFATRAIEHHLAQDYTDVALAPVEYVPEGHSDGMRHSSHFKANFDAVSRETREQIIGNISYIRNHDTKMFLTNTQSAPALGPHLA